MHSQEFETRSATAASRRAGARRFRRPTIAEPLEQRVYFSSLFGPPGPGLALGYYPAYAAVGDFNGDGRNDLALDVPSSNKLDVFLGDGSGGFSTTPVVTAVSGSGNLEAAGDFTGDGRIDIPVLDHNSSTVSLLLGDGNGGFEPGAGPPNAVSQNLYTMTAGRFTSSGHLDLITANEFDGTVTVLLGKGDGTFVQGPGSPVKVKGDPIALAVGDFNGDGKLDVAVGLTTDTGTGSVVEVLLGNGHGRLTPAGPPIAVPRGAVNYSVDSLVTADFNGDGRPDLAVIESVSSGTLSIFLNKGNGTFSRPMISPIQFNIGATIAGEGDFTGSGRQDLVIEADFGQTDILLGNGNGTFSIAPGSPVSPYLIAVGDFYGNAEPDLVSVDANNVLTVAPNTSPQLAVGTLGAAVSATLPASVIGGARISGKATVTITAPAGQSVRGPVSVALFTSPDQSLLGGTQIAPAVKRSVSLRAGQSTTLHIPFASFTSTTPGTLYLLAAVSAPDGTTTAAVGPSLTITKRVVSVMASNVIASPASVALGEPLSVGLTLQNNGNVSAARSAALTISLSASQLGTDGQPVAMAPLHIALRAWRSKAYRVRFRVPAGMVAGNYYVVASLAVGTLGDTNAADGIAVSGTSIVVR